MAYYSKVLQIWNLPNPNSFDFKFQRNHKAVIRKMKRTKKEANNPTGLAQQASPATTRSVLSPSFYFLFFFPQTDRWTPPIIFFPNLSPYFSGTSAPMTPTFVTPYFL
jgi:hypothetical protein